MSDTPHFRFYPAAYEDGEAFFQTDTICFVCEKRRGLGAYGPAPIHVVCPWCIASGEVERAAMQLLRHHADFNYFQKESGLEASVADEVKYRTPSFFSWQDPPWPARRGWPMICEGWLPFDDVRNHPGRWAATLEAGRVDLADEGKPLEEIIRDAVVVCQATLTLFRAWDDETEFHAYICND